MLNKTFNIIVEQGIDLSWW